MFNKHGWTSGFTLIEMVIAIVIISAGLAGLLMAFNVSVKSSADPMITKQMLAVAENMMEETLLKPFAPVGVAAANSLVSCGSTAASRAGFDDVADYQSYQTNGVCDIDGALVPGLGGYDVKVTVAPPSGSDPLGDTLGSAMVKKVTVAVSQGNQTMTLVGWRTNYAAP